MDRMMLEHEARENNKCARRSLCYGLGQAAAFTILITVETYLDCNTGYTVATAVFALGAILAGTAYSIGTHGSAHFMTIVHELNHLRVAIGNPDSSREAR